MCGSNIGVLGYRCDCIFAGLNMCSVQGGEMEKDRQGQWGGYSGKRGQRPAKGGGDT